MPATALSVFVPLRVPLLGLVPIASVIDAALVVTVLPPASFSVTTGCVAQAVPPVPPPGCVVTATCAGAPAVMLNVPVVAPVSPALEAASVYPVPALLIDRLPNVTTPLT